MDYLFIGCTRTRERPTTTVYEDGFGTKGFGLHGRSLGSLSQMDKQKLW